MNTHIIPIKRALLSVSDKNGIVELAKALITFNIEIISTGGTAALLKEAAIPHRHVEELTGFTDLLGGRVKTLHPAIHGAILAKRDEHEAEIKAHDIPCIDLVVVNFYPFAKALDEISTPQSMVEYIDIGGPTMVRAAAKNFAFVSVVVDPLDYAFIINELKKQQGLSLLSRQVLAKRAFALTAQYDAMVYAYFSEQDGQTEDKLFPSPLLQAFKKNMDLRYGENPHQAASAYQIETKGKIKNKGVLASFQLQGKALSYNNIIDADAAFNIVNDFTQPTCAIIKHTTPCAVASAETIELAYHLAYEADSLSAFGGIVALNRSCTKAIAVALSSIFIEVIIAPGFTEEALELLTSKPNLRILQSQYEMDALEMRFIAGGVLLQEKNHLSLTEKDLQSVTKIKPNAKNISALLFAFHVIKHIKSNAILLTKGYQTVGIGCGQVSRVDAVQLAIKKAGKAAEGAYLASDAFFPFRDSIDLIAAAKVKAIIQPGGSIRDQEVIAACDDHGIAMVFTGIRSFKH